MDLLTPSAAQRAPSTTAPPGVTAAVVADRWPLMRVGLARAVRLAGLRVAGEGRDLPDAAALARQSAAGLLVVGDTDDATVATLRRLPAGLLVVVLVRQVTRDELGLLLGAGVAGVSLRSATAEELSVILRRAVAGERAVSPALVSSLVGWPRPDRPPGPVGHGSDDGAAMIAGDIGTAVALTAKERQVLVALAAGATNQQIAEALFVTPATVKTHLAHIYGKLDVSGRHEALSRAIALGIVH